MAAVVRKLRSLFSSPLATGVPPVHDHTRPSSEPDIKVNLGVPETAAPPAAAEPGISGARSLTELLLPVTLCTGTFFSITPAVHDQYQNYPLYVPLLAVVLLGILTSFVAIYYALHHQAPPSTEALDASTAEADEVARNKEKLLELGLIYSAVAIVLRILLQLNPASLLPLTSYVLAGGVAGAAYFYFVSPPPHLKLARDLEASKR